MKKIKNTYKHSEDTLMQNISVEVKIQESRKELFASKDKNKNNDEGTT